MNSSNLVLPNFVIAGAQRSGTTFLWSLLRQHDGISVPALKELHFFSPEAVSGLDTDELRAQYAKFFVECDNTKLVGEASPDYLFWPHSLRELRRACPDVKVLLLLRNPVDRAVSHYWLGVRNGTETLTFWDAVRREAQRILINQTSARNYSYITRGLYADQVARCLEIFPRESVMIVRSEDLYEHTQAAFDIVCDFLGAPHQLVPTGTPYGATTPAFPRVHRALSQLRLAWRDRPGYWRAAPAIRRAQDFLRERQTAYPPMTPSERALLRHVFEGSNARLQVMLGVDLRWE